MFCIISVCTRLGKCSTKPSGSISSAHQKGRFGHYGTMKTIEPQGATKKISGHKACSDIVHRPAKHRLFGWTTLAVFWRDIDCC